MNLGNEKVRVERSDMEKCYKEWVSVLRMIDMTERTATTSREEYWKMPNLYNEICMVCGFTSHNYQAEMMSRLFVGES